MIVTDKMMFMLILFVTFIAMNGIVSDYGGWFGSMDKLANLASKPDLMAWHGMKGMGLQFETAGGTRKPPPEIARPLGEIADSCRPCLPFLAFTANLAIVKFPQLEEENMPFIYKSIKVRL